MFEIARELDTKINKYADFVLLEETLKVNYAISLCSWRVFQHLQKTELVSMAGLKMLK